MRKFAGFMAAAALVLPIGLLAAPAGAASGTSCKTTSGTATFSPALPKVGNTTVVLSTVTSKAAKIGGCAGGGVKSGTAAISAKFSKATNCASLASAGSTNPAKGTETIVWNTKATSKIALTLTGVAKNPTQAKVTGTVTSGLFKGLHETGTVNYTIPAGGCATTALTTVTFAQITPLKLA